MNTLQQTAVSDRPEWKTQEYHGKQMHVWTELCAQENPALSGHGHQWAFTVTITEPGAGPMVGQSPSAKSEPGLLYSTQAIAEDMGFLKGRELIEGA